VIGGEAVNSENLSGLHLADGATFFFRDGHEYDDLFPSWDWRKIPGTTCAQDDHPLIWPKGKRGASGDFVGAATDPTGACAAMDFHRGDLRAKKAWLFARDIAVCLGADITSTGEAPIVTTINQCLKRGEVRMDANELEHDGLRYVLPAPQRWNAVSERRTGNWRSVFDTPSTPKQDVSRDVFTLTIDHGVAPTAASYAYYVLPSSEPQDGRVKVISDSAALQAATIDDRWCGIVFWSAGKARFNDHDIAVDQPCIVVVDTRDDFLHMTLADPTQKLKSLRITIDDKPQDVALPQGGDAGRSVALP
jgi:chondroitin AC lyase